MKKRNLLSVIIYSLILTLTVSCTNTNLPTTGTNVSNNSSTNTTTSPSVNSTNQNSTSINNNQNTSSGSTSVVPNTDLYAATIASTAPNYYESVRGLKGEALKNGLHKIIKGHTTFSYNSSINDYMKEYDAVYGNPNKINLIYTGSADKNTGFNKEHVWAKSHGKFGTSTGPGSDLHNLRPCIDRLNSIRGNLDFAEGGNERTEYPGNYVKDGVSFEPRDDFKGDVARTIFYMATRYEGSEGSYPDLELDSPSDKTRYLDLSKTAKGVHGEFDDLYKWATSGQDPVDNYEVNRNNIIYDKYQHNRNPFVDHPEFIVMIYDKNYNGPGALNDPLDGSITTNPQESASIVINLINKIGTVTLESLPSIEEAEKAYNNLSTDAKEYISNEIYQKLVSARNEYNKLYDANAVNIVISLIAEIGEVSLDSIDAINKAENAYEKLSPSQKEQITNYDTLVEARQKYDELKAEVSGTSLYTGDFSATSSISNHSYTKNNLISVNGQSWLASCSYKAGNEDFRLGYNSNSKCSLDNKFASIIGTDVGASLEMQWSDSSISTIKISVSGNHHGTINKVYIVKSNDNGSTYQVCKEFDFSKTTYLYEYSGSKGTNTRYAIIITGDTPRLYINKIELLS